MLVRLVMARLAPGRSIHFLQVNASVVQRQSHSNGRAIPPCTVGSIAAAQLAQPIRPILSVSHNIQSGYNNP